MKNIKLKISGMKCMGCVNTVQNILSTTKGVLNVEVDLDKGSALIKANDDVNEDELCSIINNNTNYKAVVE
ncbi:MAG: heavy metal-associated domain-containing protein [Spirochaetota bacterium]